MKKGWIVAIVVAALIIGGVTTAVVTEARWAAPALSPLHYPWSFLAHQAETMNKCAKCHETEKMHTCRSCHDEHGAVEMEGVPFDDLILLQGDVPEPGYIASNEILPYPDRPDTHISVIGFLADHGVEEFESVTLASRDEGWVTIEREYLTEDAVFMPHVDGLRFAAKNLHISTWLKGVWRIIVVAPDKPLILDGYRTSFGRLLLRDTRSITIEQTDTMLHSDEDGQVRKGKTAGRIEGAGLSDIVSDPGFDELRVRDAHGGEHTLSASQARGAVLAQMGSHVTLVLPDHSRADWIVDVVELISEE